MSKVLYALLAAFLFIAQPVFSWGAPLKTFVAEFAVSGAPNRDELKTTLQGLLASRLNPGRTTLVETADRAELLLNGSYSVFGKMFSIDLLIKHSPAGTISKLFEQGESQDELLPALGRLTGKLDTELARMQSQAHSAKGADPVQLPLPAAVPAEAKAVVPVVVHKTAPSAAATDESYVVRSGSSGQNTPGTWSSDPMNGVFTSLAVGRTLPSGEREIFIAGERSIRYLLKGVGLKQVAELGLPVSAKILAIDSADLDRDGTPEIYVSIIDRKTVSSRVYLPGGDRLELVADNQPWLYRGIGNDFRSRVILIQAVDSRGEYAGDIAELVKSGSRFEAANSRSAMPRYASVFNLAGFRDAAGVERRLVADEEGKLIVYAADGSEIWKSSEKYGGSESYFSYESIAQMRSKGNAGRRNFLEQRIAVMPDGTLIVPRNEGTFSIGHNRSYNKHSLFGLKWNGSVLKEVWHTRSNPAYLADYAFDDAAREVLLLEVVQRGGLMSNGRTVLSINRLD